jgi:hypothetical protein
MKKGWKPFSPKNKVAQDSGGNEDPDSNKTKINYTKELKEAHKNILEEEILQVITENFMELVLNKVNQNVQEALKKIQEDKNKAYEKTQKQINELIGALNKHQSEYTIYILLRSSWNLIQN